MAKKKKKKIGPDFVSSGPILGPLIFCEFYLC